MSLPGGPASLAAVLLSVGLLTACSSPGSDDEASRQPTSPRSPSADRSGRASLPPPGPCTTPSRAVLAQAAAALAAHPGPVRASTLVRAATTDTGTWYVIGLDRAYVLDSGEPAGGASRSLGLTNAAGGEPGSSMIPIGGGEARGDVRISWRRVSWTGETLEAGRRATRRAVGCLDAAKG
jgi:hypothetical protein